MWRWCSGRFLLYIPLLLCLVFICRAGLFESRVPAFRDGFAFYYPQAVWLSQRASEGEYFPSWSAAEGLGVSVAGQPSTGLFYPLRVVWLLPSLSVAQRYALFIVVHLLIAAAGVRWAAAKLSFSTPAQWLAGISYALSCPVIFQHTNLIYLGSAAWLGWVLGSLAFLVVPLRIPSASSTGAWWWSASLFSLACSLMFLAGDPHTAVNAMLLAGMVAGMRLIQAICGLWKQRRAGNSGEDNPAVENRAWKLRRSQAWSPVGWGALVGVLCLLCTAIQWLPAAGWSMHSNRHAQGALLVATEDAVLQRVLAEAASDDSPRRIFDFSLPPWYWLTTLWPTLGGHYLPGNSRLFDLLPAEGRMWIPSLYFGLAPCMLACLALVRARHIVSVRWLIGLFLFATLASLGSYSIVWLLREAFGALGRESWAASLPYDPFPSLYWVLSECVPGYSLFRYPAKWSVWLAAALSLLAAAGMDQIPERFRASSSRSVLVLCSLSWLGTIVSASIWWLSGEGRAMAVAEQFARVASDRLLGQPSLTAVASNCLHAFGLPSLLLTLAVAVVLRKSWLPWITLGEMCWVATYWLIFAAAPTQLPTPYPPLPANLSSNSLLWCPSELRVLGGATSTWLGKFGLLTEHRFLSAPQSIEPRVVVSVCRWLARRDELRVEDDELEGVLRALGVTHRLVRLADGSATTEPGDRASFAWKAIERPLPLCELRPLKESFGQPLEAALAELDYGWQTSDRLQLDVRSQRPVRLLVRQFNDGGWQISDPASLDGRVQVKWPAIPSGSLFVEIPLPRGEFQLILKRRWMR